MTSKIETQFGWIITFPIVWLMTVYLKLKNRSLNTANDYARHQKEFFSITFLRNKSDKFHKVRKKVAEYALNGKNKKALDIATGHGFQAKALMDIGISDVFAIDIVPERIESCKKMDQNKGIKFQVMDAANLSYRDKFFDCSTVSAALHDMPTAVKRKAILEIVRVTQNTIVIFEPRTFKNPFIAFIYGIIGEILDVSLNFKEYVKDDLSILFQDHNFDMIKDENVWYGILNIKVFRSKI